MANPNCRSCDRAGGGAAYCGSCAAAIMGRALNPSSGERRKKFPRARPDGDSAELTKTPP